MAARQPVWGLDIGQSAIKAMRVQAVGDRFEILDFAAVEHQQLLSSPNADATALVRASLEKLLEGHDLRRQPVVVAVPGQQTLTRFTKLPPVEPKKIAEIVNYEAQQQIPFDMDEVVWDYEIFTAKDSPDVEVGIFAIRKELIRAHLAQCTALGIEPVAVQTAPIASYNALRVDGQFGEETTLLLNVGALATDLIVAEGNSIWARPVPLGGNNFTEALMQAFKLSFGKAEQLKRTAHTSKYARQIFQAMRPVFADLVSEVQRSIGFYASTHRQSEIKRVVGMGNAFGLPGLQKFLQQNLQIRVDKFAGFQRMAPSDAARAPDYAQNMLSLPVAFGAAVQGLGQAAVNSSLLPTDLARQQLWRRKRPLFAASAAAVALAAGLVWLGHLRAARALAAGIGSVTSPAPRAAASLEEAERILQSPPSRDGRPALEYAMTIGGALERLTTEWRNVPQARPLEERARQMAQLPAANPVVPQVVNLIHDIFAEAVPATLREIKNPEEYLAFARKNPRDARDEVWIVRLLMKFDRIDAARAYSAGPASFAPPEAESAEAGAAEPRPGAGWTVLIYGRTTSRDPTKVLDSLVARLEADGRNPDRRFWINKAKLERLTAGEEAPARAGDLRSGTGGPPQGRMPEDERMSGAVPGRVPPPSPTVGGPANLQQAKAALYPVKGIDPVTGESTRADSAFVISLIVRSGPPPKQAQEQPGTPQDAPANGTAEEVPQYEGSAH